MVNVALADGSVQGFTGSRMGQALQATGVATNRLAMP
jgi:prepilin-type processing-associated H-X9-DG protein